MKNKKKITTEGGTVCISCNQPSDDLRLLISRNKRGPGTIQIGPYDRFCAYEDKNGKIPAYNTVPRNALEFYYRIFIGAEIPFERSKLIRSLINLFLFILFHLPSLIIYYFYITWGIKNFFLSIEILGIFFLFPGTIIAMYKMWETNDLNKYIFLDGFLGFAALIYERFDKKYNGSFDKFLKIDPPFFQNVSLLKLLYLCLLTNLFLILTPSVLLLVVGIIIFPFIMLYGVVDTLFIFLPIFLLFFIFIYLRAISFRKIGSYLVYQFKRINRYFKYSLGSEKYLGNDNEKNFELYWEGKITKQDLPSNFYTFSFIYTFIEILLFGYILLDATKLKEFFIKIQLSSIIQVFFQVFPLKQLMDLLRLSTINLTYLAFLLTTYIFISIIGILYRSVIKKWLIYLKPPNDIYHEAMKSYADISEDLLPQATKLTIKGTKPYFMINCPICRKEVDVGIRCKNCYSVFHREHLAEYLESTVNDMCPVCRMPADQMFT